MQTYFDFIFVIQMLLDNSYTFLLYFVLFTFSGFLFFGMQNILSRYIPATPVNKSVTKKKEISPTPKDAPKEGLRSRRGKTSIEAAMELKAKRSTLIVSCVHLIYSALKRHLIH